MRVRGLALALAAVSSAGLWALVASWTPAAAAGDTNAASQADADNIPAEELPSFARAAREVFSVRQAYAPKVQAARSEIDASEHIVAAQKAMEAAIRREGMTVARYNEILAAAQRNSVLAARIQELVDKAAAGK